MTNSKPKGMSQNVHSCSKTCHTPLVTCRNIGQNAHTKRITESVWHDDKWPQCCQSISQSTYRAVTWRNDTWCTRKTEKASDRGDKCHRLKAWVTETKLEWGSRRHAGRRQSSSQCRSPLVPARGLTSRFVGVFRCHQVCIHLHGLGWEAHWIKRPRLGSECHTQVSICIYL